MMVRFSCFNSQIYSQKPKKTQSFAESMSILHNSAKVQSFQAPLSSKNSASFNSEEEDMNGSCKEAAFDCPPLERGWKSEDMDGKLSPASKDSGVHQAGFLKKSRSEGGLNLKGETYADEDTEDESQEAEQGNFLDGCNDVSLGHKNDERTAPWDTPQESLFVNNGPIFSIGDHDNSDGGEGVDISDARSSGENVVDSGERTPLTPVAIVRSISLPNISSALLFPEESMRLGSRPRSSDDLDVLNSKGSAVPLHEMKMRLVQDWGRNHTGEPVNVIFDNSMEHCDDILNYHSPAMEWIVPIEESGKSIDYGSSSSHHFLNELPGKDFKIKRIEDWVIDVQPCFPVEEEAEISQPDDKQKRDVSAPNSSITLTAAPSTEIAKRYISSLNPAAATAQLANHGLTVVPFLSAFVSLKVLNLSGNAIGRITAGSLPRGLHMLNLSKNQITTIEGLRELTRLRVLDLSYNRILRIGHGLASCSSLKELYLAGNKIGEVEGLHRLLKLNILDLRFNKISTAKCLGQLAANYNSLQAISLEGNPAQKNVGDEQLKKQLQGLLPKLTYYNRQLIKVGTSKDAGDRSVLLGMGSHQSRSDYKSVRKGSHGTTSKVGSSSGRRSHHGLSFDKSKGKLARLPPSGVGNKASGHPRRHHHQQHLDPAPMGDRLKSLKDISMRRSRSEGTLGAI